MILAAVALAWTRDDEATGSTVAEASPPELVCRAIEQAGNGVPDKTQRCQVLRDAAGLPLYRITLRGDYGDDVLLVGVLLARETAALDSIAGARGSSVIIADVGQPRSFFGPDTLKLAAVRQCVGSPDERMCLIGLF